MTKSTSRARKYRVDNLLPALRVAARLRKEMLAAGLTDNGGAIHSAERILDILAMAIKYPALSHINNLRRMENAPFSPKALRAHNRGERVLIEHVAPRRELTRSVIDLIGKRATNKELIEFIRAEYTLALLTPAETTRLNRQNRSRRDPDRLVKAGIILAAPNLGRARRARK